MSSSKSARIAVVFKRLRAATPVASFEEARALLERVLDAVEDELSGAPFISFAYRAGEKERMYSLPPNEPAVSCSRSVTAFQATKHVVSFGANGALRIDPQAVVDQPGIDGRRVADLLHEELPAPGAQTVLDRFNGGSAR